MLTIDSFSAAPSETDPARAIYVVAGDSGRREILGDALAGLGLPVRVFGSARELLAAVGLAAAGCVLLDPRLPDQSGGELIERLARAAPALAVVVVAESPTTECVVRAMRRGAVNVLESPAAPERLAEAAREALEVSDGRAAEVAQRGDAAAKLARLTGEQSDVLRRALEGVPNKTIAAELDMSLRKVERLRAGAFQTLGVGTLAEAARLLHVAEG
jgi:FixJ family two-component response regulator